MSDEGGQERQPAEAFMVAEATSRVLNSPDMVGNGSSGASGDRRSASPVLSASGGGAAGTPPRYQSSGSPAHNPRRASRETATGNRLFDSAMRQNFEDAGGLRRRRVGSSTGTNGADVTREPVVVQDADEAKHPRTESGGLGLWDLLTAPVRVPVQMGRSAITKGVAVLNPFSWVELMFHWVHDITPDRLHRLGEIVWDALSHITGLARTRPGHELGYSLRNVVDSLVETISAPKGRAAIMETAHVFVRAAEAMDTPEAHAAYAQVTSMCQKGLEVMATDEASDLLRNVNDFVSRLAKIANAPETTVAVAEFVTTICSALEDEHRTFRRERLRDFSPFPPGGVGGDVDESGSGKKQKPLWGADVGQSSALIDEDLVLGPRTEDGDRQTVDHSSSFRDAEPGDVLDEGMATGSLLPDWDRERMMSINQGETNYEERARKARADFGLKNAVEAGLAKKREKQGVTEGEDFDTRRAMVCAGSFLFFLFYTVFAVVGIRATVLFIWHGFK